MAHSAVGTKRHRRSSVAAIDYPVHDGAGAGLKKAKHGRRKWQKQRQPRGSQKANACAARSASKSTCRRAGPGMIILLVAGERLVPLKGFPGVVWQRSKKKRRIAGDDPFELSQDA